MASRSRMLRHIRRSAMQPPLSPSSMMLYTHKFFKAARSREDVIAQRDAIAAWARVSYGWMGRSPDYKAAFLNTLGANAEFYGKFADNARAWHKRGQEAVLYLNHALVNPPIDRNKAVEQVKDVYTKPRAFLDLLLGQALALTDAGKVSAHQLAHIHARSDGGLPTLSLSTIVCIKPAAAKGTKRVSRRTLDSNRESRFTKHTAPALKAFEAIQSHPVESDRRNDQHRV